MSTASEIEARTIVQDVLNERLDRKGTQRVGEIADAIVDRLLETHTIVRQAPRILRRSDDSHPAAQVARAGQKPNGVTQV